MSNSMVTSLIGNISTIQTHSDANQQKRYSLVKWLENSQFDAHNEWQGRLTSVPHTNIIDFEAEELKAGIEINVIRNNGEIWRAQIIIPKTASNTIDLPPSSYKKIRTKAMGTTGGIKQLALSDLTDQMEIANTQTETNSLDEFERDKHMNNQNQLIILTNAATSLQSNSDSSITQECNHIKSESESLAHENDEDNRISLTTEHDSPSIHLTENNENKVLMDQQINSNQESTLVDKTSSNLEEAKNESKTNKSRGDNISNQKEWQFLQTAINEAGLTDFYQTYNDLANTSTHIVASNGQLNNNNNQILQTHLANSSTKLNHNQQVSSSLTSSITNSPTHNQQQQIVTVSDLNIETILQMQCELLEQQKELKTIELETMDHLRQLHQNISKLTSKFDSFEHNLTHNINNVSNSINSSNFNNNFNHNVISNNNGANNCQILNQENGHNSLKAAKNVFNKLNSTIGQQLKLVDNELLKELCQTTNNNNTSINGGSSSHTTTVSLLSPSTLMQNPSTITPIQSHVNDNINIHKSLGNNDLSSLINNSSDKSISNLNNTLIPLNSLQIVNATNIGKTTKQQAMQQQHQTQYLNTTPLNLNNSNNNSKLGFYHQSTNSSLISNITGKPINIKTVIDLNESNNDSFEIYSSKNKSVSTKAQGLQTQISLNRFLRESVKQKMGCDFLITNAVSDIPINVMRSIKKEAFDKYLPNDRRPIKAWGLAMASLRCLKRDLVKNRNKQLAAAAAIIQSNLAGSITSSISK